MRPERLKVAGSFPLKRKLPQHPRVLLCRAALPRRPRQVDGEASQHSSSAMQFVRFLQVEITDRMAPHGIMNHTGDAFRHAATSGQRQVVKRDNSPVQRFQRNGTREAKSSVGTMYATCRWKGKFRGPGHDIAQITASMSHRILLEMLPVRFSRFSSEDCRLAQILRNSFGSVVAASTACN